MEKLPSALLTPGIASAEGILGKIVMLITGLDSPGLGATFPPGPGTAAHSPALSFRRGIKDPALINSCSAPNPDCGLGCHRLGARMPQPSAGCARSRWSRAVPGVCSVPLWGCGCCFSVPVPCNAQIGHGKIRDSRASFIPPLFFFPLVFAIRGLSFPVWISLRALMALDKKELWLLHPAASLIGFLLAAHAAGLG